MALHRKTCQGCELCGKVRPRGVGVGNTKISDEQKADVKRRALAGENQRLLGLEFGISRAQVCNIKQDYKSKPNPRWKS
jgi:hypothetical protein